MEQKFPRDVSWNSGNCWISEKRSVQMKFLEIPARSRVEWKLSNFPEKIWKFGHTSQGCPVNNPWYPYRSRYRSFYELAVTYPVHDLNDVCKVDHTHRGNVPYSLRFFLALSSVFFFFCLFSPTANPGPRLLAREKLLLIKKTMKLKDIKRRTMIEIISHNTSVLFSLRCNWSFKAIKMNLFLSFLQQQEEIFYFFLFVAI